MKAFLMDRHGGPEVLHLGDAPDPVAAAGHPAYTMVVSGLAARRRWLRAAPAGDYGDRHGGN